MATLAKGAKVDAKLGACTEDFLTDDKAGRIAFFAFVALLGSDAGFGLRVAYKFLVGVTDLGWFGGVRWEIAGCAGLGLDGGRLAEAACCAAIEGRIV
jgi:hypothetical protein